MAVISIIITASEEEIVSGIPRNIALSSNIPSSIFYTLDGSDPNLFSTIYVAPFGLPTNLMTVVLKILASNGIDSSPIITEIYQTNILHNARLPHSTTDAQAGNLLPDLYPFGTNSPQPNGQYLNPANASFTVDDPALTQYADGYDGFGNQNDFSNNPFNIENYEIKYSTTNAQGETGRGIGTLPGNVIIQMPEAPPEESEVFSKTFDPRALVIFQDYSTENPDDPVNLNRQFYSSQDVEKGSAVVNLYNSGLDTQTTTGSFVRKEFNSRTGEWSFYYFDSSNNRWIVSKQAHIPSAGGWDGNLSGIKMGRNSKVFEWNFGQRRVLF